MAATITSRISSEWNGGFVAELVLANPSLASLTWTLEFDADFTLANLWNARVVSHSGTHFVLAGLDYDLALPATGQVSVGFQATGQSAGWRNVTLTVAGESGVTPSPAPLPELRVADARAAEPGTAGGTEAFVVTLSTAAADTVTVAYTTQDGTALAGTDYVATSGTLSFAPGETSKTVNVALLANDALTQSAHFGLALSTPSGATLADAAADGAILVVPPGALRLAETVQSEWQDGFVAQFDIANDGGTVNDWTVSFDAAFGLVNLWNAHVVSHVGNHWVLGANDYNAAIADGGHAGFGFQAAGASAQLSNLAIASSTASGTVQPGGGSTGGSGGSGGTSGGGSSSSSGAALAAHSVFVSDPASGTATAHFTVTLAGTASGPVTVDYATQDGTAQDGADYTGTHGTLTFAAGETSKTVDVQILADPSNTGHQTFTLELTNPSGASIADGSAIGTILDSALSAGNPGWLHTDGNQIVNDQGVAVQLNSVSWFGFEGGNYSAHGLWTRDYHSMMDQMVELGFNSIRIPYCDQMFDAASKATGIDFAKNPDLVGLSPLEILDRIVDYAGRIGLKIVLDHHRNSAGAGTTENGLWYDSKYSEADMTKNWEMLADRYGSSTAVVGADLHNEPHAAATWGDNSATDWAAAAERIGNAVLAHAPNWLIFVEGIGAYNGETYWWGGDLEGVKDRPLDLAVDNRLVYSPHDYPNSIYPQTWFSDPTFPANEPTIFSDKWGFIYEQNLAPVWVGEWGSKLTDPKDVLWADAITDYMHGDTSQLSVAPGEFGPSWSWWAWNPNSGDTGGILKDDWTTVNLNKIELLQPLMYGLIPTEVGSATTQAVMGANLALGLTDHALAGPGADNILFRNDNGETWFWAMQDGDILHQGSVGWLQQDWTIIGTGDTDGSGKASVLVRTANGFFGMWQLDDQLQGHYIGSPGTMDASWTALAMRDIDGDGHADVLFRHETDGNFWTWNLNATAVTGYNQLGTAPVGAAYAGTGDFNGDGKGDLLWRLADGSFGMSFTDGSAITTTKVISPPIGMGYALKGVADYSGDGKADLLLADAAGDTQIWELAGNMIQQIDHMGTVDPTWQVASVGDLDGDGAADILWHNSGSGELYAWHMAAGQIANQGTVGWLTADWHVVTA